MKKMKLWSLVIMAAMMLSVVYSCGGDDNSTSASDPSGGPAPTVNGKRLVSIKSTYVIGEHEGRENIPIEYNTLGQIIRHGNSYYTYENNKITRRINDTKGEYYLTNGRVTSDIYYSKAVITDDTGKNVEKELVSTRTYEYDSYGQLISIKVVDSESSQNDYYYTWQDGNITRIVYNFYSPNNVPGTTRYTYEYSFSYTNYPNSIPFFFIRGSGLNFDAILMWQGYVGKNIKNLPANNLKNGRLDYSWDYQIDNGLVTKVTSKYDISSSYTYTLEWQ